MFNNAARRGALIAAAVSTALVAPSLAPVANAQSSSNPNLSSSSSSSSDQGGATPGTTSGTTTSVTTTPAPATGAAVKITRNVTVKPGEAAKLDLTKAAGLGDLANIKITAGGDIARVDNGNLIISAPASGESKVKVEATVGGRTVQFDLNVTKGDATTVTPADNDLTPSPGPGFLVIPDLSGLAGSSNLPGSADLGSSDLQLPGKCEAALVGLGVPLLALIPLGLASQLAIGGTAQFADQIGTQIQNANTELQRQAGILNPQLASQVEAANNSLKQFGLNAGTATLGVAAVGTGVALTAGVLAACLSGDSASSGKAPATTTTKPTTTTATKPAV